MPNFIQNQSREASSSDDQLIVSNWFQFFKDFKSGCTFAALVARKPEKFGWSAIVSEPVAEQIDSNLRTAIEAPEINTLSLIFPQVTTQQQLESLINEVQKLESVRLEFKEEFDNAVCFGLRLIIGTNISWITGFGDFSFLPKTRQAPFTSLTLRVKPKPIYEWVMKTSKQNELHLADTNVSISSKSIFEKMWNASFESVKKLLGHSPDLRSAAKTTFSLPLERPE